jgi:hypothetical protein
MKENNLIKISPTNLPPPPPTTQRQKKGGKCVELILIRLWKKNN